MRRKSIEKFTGINEKLYDAGWKAQFVSGIMFPIMNFISNLGYVLICVIGGTYAAKKALEIGRYHHVHTVLPVLHAAHRADVQHRQRHTVHDRLRRARV